MSGSTNTFTLKTTFGDILYNTPRPIGTSDSILTVFQNRNQDACKILSNDKRNAIMQSIVDAMYRSDPKSTKLQNLNLLNRPETQCAMYSTLNQPGDTFSLANQLLTISPFNFLTGQGNYSSYQNGNNGYYILQFTSGTTTFTLADPTLLQIYQIFLVGGGNDGEPGVQPPVQQPGFGPTYGKGGDGGNGGGVYYIDFSDISSTGYPNYTANETIFTVVVGSSGNPTSLQIGNGINNLPNFSSYNKDNNSNYKGIYSKALGGSGGNYSKGENGNKGVYNKYTGLHYGGSGGGGGFGFGWNGGNGGLGCGGGGGPG